MSLTHDYQEAADEIERLRGECAEVYAKWQLERVDLLTEIERLRAKLERAHTMWQDVRIELKRLQEYYEPDPEWERRD